MYVQYISIWVYKNVSDQYVRRTHHQIHVLACLGLGLIYVFGTQHYVGQYNLVGLIAWGWGSRYEVVL